MLDNLVSSILSSLPSSPSPSFHPLHVVLSESSFLKFADDNNYPKTNNVFVGVISVDDELPKNIFVMAHLLNLDVNETKSEYLHLYVTPEFLKHYNFIVDNVVSFKPVQCFPITRVVFCATSQDSYKWAKSSNWHKNMLIAACQNQSLCRRNDVLLVSSEILGLKNYKLLFDFRAVVCDPIEQGLITSETSIAVVFVSNVNDYLHLSQKSELFSQKNFSIQFSRQPSQDIEQSIEKNGKLKLHIVQKHAQSIQKMLAKSYFDADPLNTILVSKSIFKLLSIHPGELLPITISSNFHSADESEHTSQKRTRLASFFPYSSKYDMNYSAYMSPCLWFNVSTHPSCLMEKENMVLEVHLKRNNGEKSPDIDETFFTPPYAKEVYVALVQSPHYDATIDCDSILKHHFIKQRYIMKGDVFGVDTKDAVNFQQKSNDLDNIRRPVVYFRVSVIEGSSCSSGYFIDVENSKLYQAGTTQCFIPALTENSPSLSPKLTYFNSPIPSGMTDYVSQLSSLVLPVLKIWKNENYRKFRISMNILLTGVNGSGKTVIVKALCQCLSLHLYQINCHELVRDSSATTEAQIKIVLQKASVFVPCVLLLENIDFIGKEKELKGENSRVLSSFSEHLKNVNPCENVWPVIVIATTRDISLLSGELSSAFLHHIHINAPLENERKEILEHLLCPYSLHPNVLVDYISQRTAGFVLGDLSALVSEALKFRYSRLKEAYNLHKDYFSEEDLALSGIHITQQDLVSALEKEQSSKAERSGAPKIPSVLWEDVGGLADAKEEILDTIQLPLKHPELLATGLRRSGVLLYGPPGTGKTLLAKAVATECSLNFLSVKGPELINMYVGQSEENVRAVFNQARNALPCIIFFDELDSLAPNRGRSGDSGGVTDRVVSQLLAELDGINNAAEVFVIGATNRPDLIDPALLRPGRFDRHVYVGIPSNVESKLSIMKALIRKLPVEKNLNLEKIIEMCPPNLTGADFYSLCTNAMMHRIETNVKLIEDGKLDIRDTKNTVTTKDFLSALEVLVPSLSKEELSQYQFINL